MPFVLALLCLVFFLCLEGKQKGDRNRRYKSWEENAIAGYREYVYAWYVYWDEIVPKVFQMKKDGVYAPGVPQECEAVFSPGSQEFNALGTIAFLEHPEKYAARQAMRRASREGYKLYNHSWCWDEHKQTLDDFAIAEERRSLENRIVNPRFCLYLRFVDPPSYIPANIRNVTPALNDKRRTHRPVASGDNWWPMGENWTGYP